MMHWMATALIAALAGLAAVDARAATVAGVIDSHVVPGFTHLANEAEALEAAARADCDPDSAPLREAYHAAFDSWIAVSHLRFGPSETDNRAFALAFWPDGRGKTPRALGRLIDSEDPAGRSVAMYGDVSVAARGFYALEFLLFDAAMRERGSAEYRCALIRTVAGDIARIAHDIVVDWRHVQAGEAVEPYWREEEEGVRKLFTALSTGLQFTSEARLGRPLGTVKRPRPRRAEARRSLRSSRHVVVGLRSLRDLAMLMANSRPEIVPILERDFDRALRLAMELDDPDFSGVSTPDGRLRVEILQQAVEDIRMSTAVELGAALGVAAGFNAMDGD